MNKDKQGYVVHYNFENIWTKNKRRIFRTSWKKQIIIVYSRARGLQLKSKIEMTQHN